MNDTLVCLGAGKAQMPVINAAKNLGYSVIAVDRNTDAPGFNSADVAFNCSTHDPASIINVLDNYFKKSSNRPHLKGILNRSSGPPVVTAAKIAKHFDIHAIPLTGAESILNKDLLRKACTEFGIPSPKFHVVNAKDTSSLPFTDYPLVVKPALSLVGKSGVSVVHNQAQYREAISYAGNASITGKVLVEDFISGSDYSFVGFVERGVVHRVCLLEEINGVDDTGKVYGRGFKTYTPLPGYDIKLKIDTLSQKISSSFNIKRSPFMASYRRDLVGNLYLIEIHLDIGGDALIESLFPIALNINFPELAVKMASGNMRFPETIDVKPSAVIFDKGTALVSERNFTTFSADTQKELDLLLSL